MLRNQQKSAPRAAWGQRQFNKSGLHAPFRNSQRNKNLEKVFGARSAHFSPRPCFNHAQAEQANMYGHVRAEKERKTMARAGLRP